MREENLDRRTGENELSMEKLMYMVIIEKGKSYDEMTMEIISKHVENIKRLRIRKITICYNHGSGGGVLNIEANTAWVKKTVLQGMSRFPGQRMRGD